MTRSRYSKKESLNRIAAKLKGSPYTSDTPNVLPGEILSEDAALSDITELLEESYPGTTFLIDDGWIPFADADQANTGTSNTVVLSPQSHTWAHEYGGIYINTGTSQAFTANTWTKITGSFQNYMENSGYEVSCDWNDDRIIINEVGVYLVTWNLSLYTDGDARSIVEVQAYSSGSAVPQSRNKGEWIVTGSFIPMSGGGLISVPTDGWPVDLRLKASANLTIKPEVGQLMVQKMVG